jgi:hypothetical protein
MVDIINEIGQLPRISYIPIMKEKFTLGGMRICIDMVYSISIKSTRSPYAKGFGVRLNY